jgi:DNA-binding MarR family transcriptional regulator
LRSPILLTARGEEVRRRIERLVASRNHALLEDVTNEQRKALEAIIATLFKSASAILQTERRLADGRPDDAASEAWRPSLLQRPDADPPLLAPDLYLLLRLLQRSAELAYNRVTGLSNFDWRLITHIAMAGPMTLSDLIVSIDRNKSQVGRAVERLAALGLVTRRKERGVSSVVLSMAPAGEDAYQKIAAEARRRDAILVEELTIREYRNLQDLLDRLTENALSLLARERTLEAKAARAGATRRVPSDED